VIIALAAALLAQQPVDAPDEDWRAIEQENLLYITVAKAPTGDPMEALLAEPKTELVVVELYPELAPNHVARMKTLAREGFYQGREFHRVIDGFMAQAGGLPNNPAGGFSGLPDLDAEFTARLGPNVTIREVEADRLVNERLTGMGRSRAGIYKGAPVGFQPAAQAMVSADGKRDVWMIHCEGSASMARPQNENGANFQFYLMRGEAAWLDAQYTAWGRVVHGQDVVNAIALGEPPLRPDDIASVRVGSDLPEAEQLAIESLEPDSAWYDAWLTENPEAGVCDAPTPTRTQETQS